MTKAKTYTFWELLNDDKIERIEIPIIQRDYAQGRQTKDVQQVRETFLNVLFNNLQSKEPIELDFIYGTINEQGVFAPLDGQQRLTTLYLLYWYCAIREGRDEARDVLSRFSYETRSSSKAFCRMLVQLEDIDFKKATISEEIENAANFFQLWNNDPTVQAMLVMLDTIHDLYEDALYDTLTIDCPIRFKFIDLKTFQLEDTLYIKMNARGKPLTPFENFKAKMQAYLGILVVNNEITDGFSKQILLKMDNQWADFFWNNHKTNYNEVYLQFIQVIITNELALNRENILLISMLVSEEHTISFEEIMKAEINHKSWLYRLEQTLDSFVAKRQEQIPSSLMNGEQLIRRSMASEITYFERLRLLAITEFFSRDSIFDQESFDIWMRYIRNVTENTLYNSVLDFLNSAQSITNLVKNIENLRSFLTDPVTKLQGFYGAQLEQEKKKAQLVLFRSNWKTLLEEAEDYPYFKGDIGFLLDFSGVTSVQQVAQWDDQAHEKAQKQFSFYYQRAIAVFGHDKLNVDRDLFTRALLTFGDYTLKKGQNYSFLTEGFDRDISWKRLFREENAKYLKELFDVLDINHLERSLQDVIDDAQIEDWRRYFVRYPRILKETCGSKRFIRYNDEHDILLLDRSATNGYCQEYYSYALYAAIKEKNIEADYYHSLGRDGEKYVEVTKLGRKIFFKDGKFTWKDDLNEEWECEDLDDVVSDIENEVGLFKGVSIKITQEAK